MDSNENWSSWIINRVQFTGNITRQWFSNTMNISISTAQCFEKHITELQCPHNCRHLACYHGSNILWHSLENFLAATVLQKILQQFSKNCCFCTGCISYYFQSTIYVFNTYVGADIFCVNPRFHPMSVGWFGLGRVLRPVSAPCGPSYLGLRQISNTNKRWTHSK